MILVNLLLKAFESHFMSNDGLKLKVQKQLKMAQRGPPRNGLSHGEKIANLVEDLKLLRMDTKDYGETKENMAKARDLRIKELEKSNGTLLEVCFSMFIKGSLLTINTFKFRFSPASIIRTLGKLFP